MEKVMICHKTPTNKRIIGKTRIDYLNQIRTSDFLFNH